MSVLFRIAQNLVIDLPRNGHQIQGVAHPPLQNMENIGHSNKGAKPVVKSETLLERVLNVP